MILRGKDLGPCLRQKIEIPVFFHPYAPGHNSRNHFKPCILVCSSRACSRMTRLSKITCFLCFDYRDYTWTTERSPVHQDLTSLQAEKATVNLIFLKCISKTSLGDFPGGPVAGTPSSQRRGPGLIPGWGSRSHMPQLRGHMQQLKPGTVKETNKIKNKKQKTNLGDI